MALSRVKDPEVYEFICKCLHSDKNMRPTARKLYESEFIRITDDEKSKESVQVGPQIRKASVEKRRSFLHTNLLNRHSVIPEEEEETSDHEN